METLKIVGAKYRVLHRAAYFKAGDDVTLVYDDGSNVPWFSGPITDCNDQRWFTPNGQVKKCDPGAVPCKPCSMSTLELIEVPESHRIAELEKEVAALKAQLAAKGPLKEGARVQVELHFLRGTIGYFDITDGVYRVDLDGLSEGEFIWLKPERLTSI